MPSFAGKEQLILQPGDNPVPFRFKFPTCSAADANDGVIPFGDTISTCTVKAYDADGNEKTSEIVASSNVNGSVVTVNLRYPTSSGPGSYKLTFLITTANAANLEFDFGGSFARSPDRFVAKDL